MEKRYSLLVVDDELEALKVVQLMLRNSPFQVTTANSGADALVQAQHGAFDVVLLDIMMPDISGVTVCGHLRSNPAMVKVPIVMLTALDDYATRRKAMQAGATDLICKPIAREELLSKLNGVMAECEAGSATTWPG